MIEKAEKQPLSKEWEYKLDKGRALISAIRRGQLVKLFEGFSKDMEVPKEYLLMKDSSMAGNNFLHIGADKGYLKQIAVVAKKYDIDISQIIAEKNNLGETFLHKTAKSSYLIGRAAFMAKELNLDLTPLFEEKVHGKTFFDVAAEQKSPLVLEKAKKLKNQMIKQKIMVNIKNMSKDTETYKEVDNASLVANIKQNSR